MPLRGLLMSRKCRFTLYICLRHRAVPRTYRTDVFLWLFDLANVFHLTFISWNEMIVADTNQPLSSHFICITAYVSIYTVSGNKPPSISIWLVGFCRQISSLHFTHHLSQLYIFVFVNNHIILHHHHVRQLLLLFYDVTTFFFGSNSAWCRTQCK